MPRSDIFVALHQDSIGGRSAVYYAVKTQRSSLPTPSHNFGANLLSQLAKSDPEALLYADTANRHGRLYIEDTNATAAILWEVDPLHVTTSDERLFRSEQFLKALANYVGVTL
jgi:N-acetylmuramoyl-L-alanine amidase